MFPKKCLQILIFSIFTVCAVQPSATHLYQQLCPKILTNINIQEPTEQDMLLINACLAFENNGTNHPVITADTWDAINSVEWYSRLLPSYARTQTTSGYIALAKQSAQMNDNMTDLQRKTTLTNYFNSNASAQEKLRTLIHEAGRAEQCFFHNFRTITEEEQEELDKIEQQLYFSRCGLYKFNESSAALELGPRLNQLHTFLWCTIPPIIMSAFYNKMQYYHEWKELEKKQFDLQSIQNNGGVEATIKEITIERDSIQKTLDRNPKAIRTIRISNDIEIPTPYTEMLDTCNTKIKKLEQYKDIKLTDIPQQLTSIQTNIDQLNAKHKSLAHFYDETIKELSEKQSKKIELSKGELAFLKNHESNKGLDIKEAFDLLGQGLIDEHRSILKFFGIPATETLIPFGASPKTVISNVVTPYSKDFFKQGFYHMPTSICDSVTKAPSAIARTIYTHITEQPVYHANKKNLCKNEWKPDAYSTMAMATTYTATTYATRLVAMAAYPYMLYLRYKSTTQLLTLIHDKQKNLIVMGHWLKSMQLLLSVIQHDATLQKLMSSEYQVLQELFNPNSTKTSADLKYLVQQLLSSSFQGNDSYLLSQQGKILATHHLMVRIKGELVPYFETQGQIDAYLAVAKLYQEFKNHPRVKFCIPTFAQSANPIMDIDGYWHPLIDPAFVVTNTLNMGTNGIKNLMITGPNAGGKTTSLMSLIINVIFAQSFGIAPSATFTLTPFAKIHSYLDITTNLQEGLSLFAAEVDRAKKLKQSILSCTPGQKTFTIIDEIFSGTNPQVASDVGFQFAANLGEMQHSMTIITTHFPRLTDLEKETKTFTNYKVADATIMPNGKVVYPFKLIPGISTQNIAAHMLHQQGII